MKYKLLIKLMVFFLVLACLGPFLIKDKDGKPYASMDNIELPRISLPKISMPSILSSKKKTTEYIPVETEILSSNIAKQNTTQEVVKIYTFKDKMGVSHYTNKKPDHENYQILYMPVSKEEEKSVLFKIKEKFGDLTQKINLEKIPSTYKPSSEKSDFSLPNIYSQPTKAIKNAKEIREKVEANYDEQDRMMKNLNR